MSGFAVPLPNLMAIRCRRLNSDVRFEGPVALTDRYRAPGFS